jgi:hypothetical protein
MVVEPDFAEILVGGQAEGLAAARSAGAVDADHDRAQLRDAARAGVIAPFQLVGTLVVVGPV